MTEKTGGTIPPYDSGDPDRLLIEFSPDSGHVGWRFEFGTREMGPMDDGWTPGITWRQTIRNGDARFACGCHYAIGWQPANEARSLAATHLKAEHGIEMGF